MDHLFFLRNQEIKVIFHWVDTRASGSLDRGKGLEFDFMLSEWIAEIADNNYSGYVI